MNRFIITAVCLFFSVYLSAQTDKEKSKQIIDIQLNTDYIFAEGNGDSKEAAFEIANSELLLRVNKARNDNGKNLVEVIDDLTPYTKKISVMRGGNRHKEFLYMLKQDAIKLTATEKKDDKEKATAKPAEDKATNITSTKPVFYLTGIGNDKPDNTDEHIETVTEAPPVVEVKETPQPTTDNKFTGGVFVSNDVHRMLLQAGTINELLKFLKQFKEGGKLSEYHVAGSMYPIPSDSYKLIVDTDKEKMIAVLTPANINIQTNEADDMRNYHGCKVLWYK